MADIFCVFQPTVKPLTYAPPKQIDFDDKYEYSQVATVNIKGKEAHIGTFYPNPTKDGIVNLDYISNQKSVLLLSIYDVAGRNILEQQVQTTKGENKLHFDFSSLEKGIYFVQLGNSDNLAYQRLLIK